MIGCLILMRIARAIHSRWVQAQEQGFVDQVTEEDDVWIQRLCVAQRCCMARAAVHVCRARIP